MNFEDFINTKPSTGKIPYYLKKQTQFDINNIINIINNTVTTIKSNCKDEEDTSYGNYDNYMDTTLMYLIHKLKVKPNVDTLLLYLNSLANCKRYYRFNESLLINSLIIDNVLFSDDDLITYFNYFDMDNVSKLLKYAKFNNNTIDFILTNCINYHLKINNKINNKLTLGICKKKLMIKIISTIQQNYTLTNNHIEKILDYINKEDLSNYIRKKIINIICKSNNKVIYNISELKHLNELYIEYNKIIDFNKSMEKFNKQNIINHIFTICNSKQILHFIKNQNITIDKQLLLFIIDYNKNSICDIFISKHKDLLDKSIIDAIFYRINDWRIYIRNQNICYDINYTIIKHFDTSYLNINDINKYTDDYNLLNTYASINDSPEFCEYVENKKNELKDIITYYNQIFKKN